MLQQVAQYPQPAIFSDLDYLAVEFIEEENFEHASLCYKKLIEMEPKNSRAYYNLGIVLHDLGKFNKSLMCYEQSIKLGYDNPARVNLNIGMTHLKLGDFKKGFQYIDLESDGAWRLGKNFAHNKEMLSDIELWEGQSLINKTLLVCGEQGFGDNIQFSRYLPNVSRLGGNVIFLCYDALYDVFVNTPVLYCMDIKIEKDVSKILSDIDYKIPLMSLPRLLKHRFDTIPLSNGYMEKTYIKDWGIPKNGINVAIAWEATDKDPRRSIPIEIIKPLFDTTGVNFIDIQKGSKQKIDGVLNLGDKIQDFSDTVDILSQVDLLVSTDAAPVHVGGALGVPVYLLLHYSADWRWFTKNLCLDFSPWYESVRIFRQESPQTWPDVIKKVEKNLQILINQ